MRCGHLNIIIYWHHFWPLNSQGHESLIPTRSMTHGEELPAPHISFSPVSAFYGPQAPMRNHFQTLSLIEVLAPTHNSDHWVITNLHRSKYDFLFLEVVLLQRKKNGWSPGKKTRRRMNRFKQAENLLCAKDDIWVNCPYEGHVIKVATRPHFTRVGNIILALVSWCLMPSIIH